MEFVNQVLSPQKDTSIQGPFGLGMAPALSGSEVRYAYWAAPSMPPPSFRIWSRSTMVLQRGRQGQLRILTSPWQAKPNGRLPLCTGGEVPQRGGRPLTYAAGSLASPLRISPQHPSSACSSRRTQGQGKLSVCSASSTVRVGQQQQSDVLRCASMALTRTVSPSVLRAAVPMLRHPPPVYCTYAGLLVRPLPFPPTWRRCGLCVQATAGQPQPTSYAATSLST